MDKTTLKAKDVIEAIRENMADSLEPLMTRTLAPSLYEVRLHPDDIDRLRGILGEIEQEARQALTDRLERLNRGFLPAWLPFPRKRMRYEIAGGDWHIVFQEDPEGTLEPGSVEVISELAAEKPLEYGGIETKRVSTRRQPSGSTSSKVESESRTLYARIFYEDDRGRNVYNMDKKQIVVGRGAVDAWTDLRLHTKSDVSRQHVRIRYDPSSQSFALKDTSAFGTTINGSPVPPSIERIDDKEHDADRWVELPDRALIGLADIVGLEFERLVDR